MFWKLQDFSSGEEGSEWSGEGDQEQDYSEEEGDEETNIKVGENPIGILWFEFSTNIFIVQSARDVFISTIY